MIHARGVITTSLAVLGLAAPCMADPPAKIPYEHEFAPGDPVTLHVRLKIGSRMRAPVGFTMDTGSVGIVMPAADLPKNARVVEAGQIEYTSSGVVWAGFWTEQPVVFTDARGAPLATATAQVFAAQRPSCTGKGPNAKHCDPAALAARPPHMMGIGFGRPDPYAFPSRNAAIHVAGVSEQSYLIDRTGIALGVPQRLLDERCIQQTLQPSTVRGFRGDWMTPTGTLSINGARSPANILLDTGINDMLIGAADKPSSGELASGTVVQLGLLGGKIPLEYKVAASPPANHAKSPPPSPNYHSGTPTSFHWIEHHDKSFVNTGITPLTRYAYYFNASKGVVALCPL
jgi:hypothetical protein